MLKILIVEDNKYKFNSIKECLESVGETNITHQISRNASLMDIRRHQKNDDMYDLLVVDMQIPLYDDKPHRLLEFGGEEIIDELKRLHIALPYVICSSTPPKDEDALDIIKYDYSVSYTKRFESIVAQVKNLK